MTRLPNDPFQVLGLAGMACAPGADLFGAIPMPDTAHRFTPVDTNDVDGGDDVLETLHLEFRRALADPSQLSGRREEWLPPVLRSYEAPPDFEMLKAQAAGSEQVLDLLGPREGLDRFIERFTASLGPVDAVTLMTESRHEEILQLFAPQATAKTPAACSVLPAATRQDHHALSPDSAVHLGASASSQRKGAS